MRKLTLLLDDDIYEGLHRVAGRGQIGKFVSEKVRPYLVEPKAGSPDALYGLLQHRAREIPADEAADAKRRYFEERYARKAAVR